MKVRLFECFKVLFGLKRPELDKKDDIYEQFHQTIKALSQRLTVMKHIEKNICEDFALSNGGWFARAVALEIQKDWLTRQSPWRSLTKTPTIFNGLSFKFATFATWNIKQT